METAYIFKKIYNYNTIPVDLLSNNRQRYDCWISRKKKDPRVPNRGLQHSRQAL